MNHSQTNHFPIGPDAPAVPQPRPHAPAEPSRSGLSQAELRDIVLAVMG